MKTWKAFLALTAVALLAVGPVSAAELSLDLNKLEAREGACRVTMVVVNARPAAIEALRADLVMFGRDGVVAKRLAVDLAPVPADKTIVKSFDVSGLGCQDIGSILLNDVTACQLAGDAGKTGSCLEAVSLGSKSGLKFFK